MSAANRFNRSSFGRLINSRPGRVVRLIAGSSFLVAGLLKLPSPLGLSLLDWSLLPLTAGAFDVCWVGAALGGPLTSSRTRRAG